MTTTDQGLLDRMIDAVQAGDHAALEAVFAKDVRLRASLPRRDVELTGRSEAVALILGWFAEASDIVRVHSIVDTVGDVWHAGYRFTLREAGADLIVEQHAYCALADEVVTSIRIICSGFRRVSDAAGRVAEARLEALGESCATLTPRVAVAMRDLRPGQVLAVLTDDPAAPDGLAAWSRMTGHELVATHTTSANTTTVNTTTVNTTGDAGAWFYLRHR